VELRGHPVGDLWHDMTSKIEQLGILHLPHASMHSQCN
jgi:hypothetical protein